MTISDSLPIQFWINGEQTFNEKVICGLAKQDCFCQPFECDDEIRIQVQDDTGNVFDLVVYDSANTELTRLAFDEILEGVYEVTFNPSDQSPPICEKIQLKIESITFDTFISRVSAADNSWREVTYGNGVFVAVSSNGTSNRVMTSPNGIDWTSRTSAIDNAWQSVAYGNGFFVAVSTDGVGNRIMVSSDNGVSWATTSSPADNSWQSVTYGGGVFVAVSQTGTGNRVMYALDSDPYTWFSATSAADNNWLCVTYGGGLFVAVASSGSNRVMTSPDGINWSLQSPPVSKLWSGVTYGKGIFVAVAAAGTGALVMTSSDGVTWISAEAIADLQWSSVAYGDGFFVAVETGGRAMSSYNGSDWTEVTTPVDHNWQSITWGEDIFVSVSIEGTGDRVMTLEQDSTMVAQSDCIDLKESHDCTTLIEYSNSSDFDGIVYETSPQPTFFLRIPAMFHEEDNPMTQEDLELSNGVIVTLRQSLQEKRLLETGYMPNYMHKKLQKVLMHEEITIDGTQWKRRDAYEADPIKKYNLKMAKVLLTKYNSVEKNTI